MLIEINNKVCYGFVNLSNKWINFSLQMNQMLMSALHNYWKCTASPKCLPVINQVKSALHRLVRWGFFVRIYTTQRKLLKDRVRVFNVLSFTITNIATLMWRSLVPDIIYQGTLKRNKLHSFYKWILPSSWLVLL